MPYAWDPEIAPALNHAAAMKAAAPAVEVHDVTARRENFNMFLRMLSAMPSLPGVSRTVYSTTTPDGYKMQMAWYCPTSRPSTPGPALLHTHGGGMILGDFTSFGIMVNNTVATSGVPMLTVDYRLAPEHPSPTPVEDCYAGLLWLQSHAAQLSVDPTRIGVMGESAGGGLAAGLTLMARDRGFRPPLAKQVLVYPMLDDRNLVPNKDLLPFCLAWSWEDNLTGWSAYLGKEAIGTDAVSQYASPSRAADLAGLPSAYVDVGTLDIFMDEDMEYARRLAGAGVETEFHLYPGCPHGFEAFAVGTTVAERAEENRIRAIKSF